MYLQSMLSIVCEKDYLFRYTDFFYYSIHRFLESHKEWFSASNYRDVNMCTSPNFDTKENIIRVDMQMENHVFGGAKIKIER